MKEMKKERRIKLISITILLVLFFQYISVVLPFIEVQAAEIATEDSNGLRWKYTLNENNEATITIFNGNSSDLGETLEIPSELDGYKVVEVKGRYYQYSQDPYLSVLYYTTNNTRVKKLRLPEMNYALHVTVPNPNLALTLKHAQHVEEVDR